MKNYNLQHNVKKIQKNDDCFDMYAKARGYMLTRIRAHERDFCENI
jgi:hypothetical protein